jgi:hypothetical protein
MHTRDDNDLLFQASLEKLESGMNCFGQMRHCALDPYIRIRDTVHPNIESCIRRRHPQPHLIQPSQISRILQATFSWSIPLHDIIAFLHKMLLKGFHLLTDEGGFKQRNRRFLQDMRRAAIKVAPRARDSTDQFLILADCLNLQHTLGPITQQMRQPGRRKIFVSPLTIIRGS